MLNPDGSASVDLGGKRILSHVGPFTLEQEGQVQEFDPSDSAVLPTGFFDRRVTRADIAVNGTLAVHFADGAVLRCDTQTEYEAWELRGPNGLLVIAVAGANGHAFLGPAVRAA